MRTEKLLDKRVCHVTHQDAEWRGIDDPTAVHVRAGKDDFKPLAGALEHLADQLVSRRIVAFEREHPVLLRQGRRKEGERASKRRAWPQIDGVAQDNDVE